MPPFNSSSILFNNTIDDGDYYFNTTNTTDHTNTTYNGNGTLVVILIFGCVPGLCVLYCIIHCFGYIIHNCIYKINDCRHNYNTNSAINKHSPIQNNKLTKAYISKLTDKNRDKIKDSELQCSICLETIKLKNYKNSKVKLVFLECGHVFHTSCIQEWVKTILTNQNTPKCPLCRETIVTTIHHRAKKTSRIQRHQRRIREGEPISYIISSSHSSDESDNDDYDERL